TPAQQRLAARYLAAREIEQWLIVDFEGAVAQRLPQILLHGEPRLGAGIHGGLEEAMDAASLGLGGVHREVGVLDQLVEFGAVLRRERDADAGVGREMMSEALIGSAYRLVNAGHEFLYIGAAADGGLDHRKFVAAKPGDEIARLDAILEAGRNRLQKLIADMVPKRVVDALEFVDVDIEQRELLAANRLAKLAIDLIAEQHPVREVGQRVVMRQMRDFLVGKPALGHVVDDVNYVA